MNFPQLVEGRGWAGLPDISKALYTETYFQPGETYDVWAEKIARKYQKDEAHGSRMLTYIKNYWYHPSTPISADNGLPISCYVSHIPDTREGIFDGYHEGMWLGAEGGGRGVYWGDVGSAGRPLHISKEQLSTMTWSEIQADKSIKKSSGTIPFFGPSDRLTYSISQAGNRRSTEAVYIPVEHADVLDSIEIRSETGDPNRRMPNLHHAVVISDAFMEAVRNLRPWDLIDPHSKKVTQTVDAYDLFIDMLETAKTETGEPFLLFIDNVNRVRPIEYVILDRKVSSSNICTEITLYTDPDTTSVCNLGSVNLEFWDEYKDNLDQVIADISDFHDRVNDIFLEMTGKYTGTKAEAFRRARKAVIEERNIGIGTMGWHSLLQSKMMPFGSPMAMALNKQIFTALRKASDDHQTALGIRCPLNALAASIEPSIPPRRNIHTIAIAPTMSISNLCNLASSGIEPWVANAFTKKLIQGTFSIKNKYLEKTIREKAREVLATLRETNEDRMETAKQADLWYQEQWALVVKHGGSAVALDWMDDYTKAVFATAFEIDPRDVVKQAGDRQESIDQSQSLNIFFPAECSYEELYIIHMMMWELGCKSRYYVRSEPATNAQTGSRERKAIVMEDDVCVACT